jgi:formylglycine-generating enzyme required for sulfatase activity
VFRAVPLNTTTLYGDVTFRMGSSREQLFEAPVDVRISSPISGEDGRRTLLIGKYEVTKAQYVYTVGAGDPSKGLELLAQATGETRVADAYARARGCNGFTTELQQILAEPVTYLTYSDYVAFVDAANLACINNPMCAERMRGFSANREVIAFLRLPLEHEWEYVARRGGSLADGRIGRTAMQAEIPDLGDGLTLEDVAHLGRNPDRVIAVGSRRAVDGIYDIFGNAAELMQNAFTSEIGYGAVGGYVARGGHFRLTAPEIRVSMRSELLPYRVDDDTGEIARQRFQYVGLRLALALPVAGSAARSGSEELAAEFEEAFTEIGSARDVGGDNFGEAGDLGVVSDTGIVVRDRVSAEDRTDVLRVTLGVPAQLTVTAEGEAGTRVMLSRSDGRKLNEVTLSGTGAGRLSVPDQLPGQYFVTVASRGGAPDSPYLLRVDRVAIQDTGLAYPTEAAVKTGDPAAVLTTRRVSLSGFVGTGDLTDYYVIDNRWNLPGLDLKVSSPEPELLTVRLLDSKLQVLFEIAPSPEGKLPPLPIPNGRSVLQVEAPDTTAQTYQLTLGLTREGSDLATSQAAAVQSPPLEAGEPFEGLIGITSWEAHFRIVLPQPQRVRLELSGFTSDLDLRVRSSTGEDQSRSHLRLGLDSEIFVQDLEAGTYFIRVAIKDGSKTTAFRLAYETSEPEIVAPKTLAEALENPTAPVYHSFQASGQEVNGIAAYAVYKRVEDATNVTVSGFSARSNLDIRAINEEGEALASSSNPGANAEVLQVGPGEKFFYLVVEAMGSQPIDSFSLQVSPFQGPVAYAPTSEGSIVSTHGDWSVTRDADGKCWAVTGWSSISPEGERLFRWVPAMRVRYTKDIEGVFFGLLTKDDEDDSISASLEVEVGGRWRATNSSWDGSFLKPTVTEDGKTVIDSDATARFTSGTRARLIGTYKGKSFEVIYSLSGYSAANREANRLCGANAAWTVK